jgi:hypothetical protein
MFISFCFPQQTCQCPNFRHCFWEVLNSQYLVASWIWCDGGHDDCSFVQWPETTTAYRMCHFSIYKFTRSIYSFYIRAKPKFQDVYHGPCISLFLTNVLSLSIFYWCLWPLNYFHIKIIQAYFIVSPLIWKLLKAKLKSLRVFLNVSIPTTVLWALKELNKDTCLSKTYFQSKFHSTDPHHELCTIHHDAGRMEESLSMKYRKNALIYICAFGSDK